MAHIDDRARYYLERSVPELREFESKEIFSKDEIRSLVQKRTEFERLILSPSAHDSDVLNYIAWDQALDNLRAKRCRRLRVKRSTSFANQGRIFQTFERGLTRFPGSAALWHKYLHFADEVNATKRWRHIMTRALRMLPGNSDLWVLAGRRASTNGDMESARGFFMRGCRFCTGSPHVWIEYARLEMEWLARLERKKGTPLYNASVAAIATESRAGQGDSDKVYDGGEGIAFNDDGDEDGDDDGEKDDFSNALMLPKSMTEATQPPLAFSDDTVRKLGSTPALAGAIPRAIFDASSKQVFFGPDVAEAFFDLFAQFNIVSSQPQLIAHVLAAMDAQFPQDAATYNCRIRQQLVGADPDAPVFPRALRAALVALWEGLAQQQQAEDGKPRFVTKSRAWIDTLLARQTLDEGLRAVLEDARRKLEGA